MFLLFKVWEIWKISTFCIIDLKFKLVLANFNSFFGNRVLFYKEIKKNVLFSGILVKVLPFKREMRL